MKLTYEHYKEIFAASGRSPMSVSKRAKIFSPFEAQNGLRTALQKKEGSNISSDKLTELDRETLDNTLQRIVEGSIISVVYTCDFENLKLTGKVSNIDLNNQVLRVIDTVIPIKNIISIELQ